MAMPEGLRAGFEPRAWLNGLDSCAFKDHAFFLCSMLTSMLQAGMGKLIQEPVSPKTVQLSEVI